MKTLFTVTFINDLSEITSNFYFDDRDKAQNYAIEFINDGHPFYCFTIRALIPFE